MTTHLDQPTAWGPPPTAAPQEPAAPAPGAGEPKQPLTRRLRRGRPEDPRWARPAFLGLLAA
ncbi:hypothetical protein ACN6K4_004547, partial [Streptomyces hayashii]